ncbi:hypothetical protein FORC71_1671 [Vibrio parahaemolyticus]|nr:hypothetical protein FORC71_1671 [Vibrio parahaemolyticus]
MRWFWCFRWHAGASVQRCSHLNRALVLREKSLDNLSLIKQVIDIFSALLSPVIAVSVAYIAYQQWKLNVSKEKRDSKSERLQIYMAV